MVAALSVLHLLALLALPARATVQALQSTIGLKNSEAMAASAPLGTRNGLTAEADLEVISPEGDVVARVYPFELYNDRFWTQPLPPEVYDRIRVGMAVRMVSLSSAEHLRLRQEGERQRGALVERQNAARREAQRAQVEELRAHRNATLERLDAVERRVAAAEERLLDAEDRMNSALLSEDRDVDRSMETIESLVDEREELQAQREVLAQKEPFPKREVGGLTTQIERLSGRIDGERQQIRASRDRTRSVRETYVSRRQEWREAVAERKSLEAEIRSLDRRLRALLERE